MFEFNTAVFRPCEIDLKMSNTTYICQHMYHVCAQLTEVATVRTLTSVQVASTLKNATFSR